MNSESTDFKILIKISVVHFKGLSNEKTRILMLWLGVLIQYIFAQSYSNGDSRFGYPRWLYLTTATIANLPRGTTLSEAHKNGSVLAQSLQAKLPSQVQYVYFQDFKDNQVNSTLWQNNTLSGSEMLLLSSHGSSAGGEFCAWDKNIPLDGSIPVNWSFGLYLKWAFIQGCFILQKPATYYQPIFNGIHSLYGFHSRSANAYRVETTTNFIWTTVTYYSTSYTYSGLVDKWVSGQQMWTSWIDAVRENVYQNFNYGCTVAIIGLRGSAYNAATGTWSEYYSDSDQLKKTYSDRIYPWNTNTWKFNIIYKTTATMGTPQY